MFLIHMKIMWNEMMNKTVRVGDILNVLSHITVSYYITRFVIYCTSGFVRRIIF